ncbi:MAG: 2-oxo acid dehydrogenase subunit E2 [Clostridia bacterium]|nr:2-oxo acid dehydrogenase subunit E2 [Clostridia bacterium]
MNNTATEIKKGNTEVQKKPRKRRFGDRPDGRRLRTISPMAMVSPFIMKTRNDTQNLFTETIDITACEKFLREQKAAGNINMGMLHIFLAAYVRTVSQRPAINRFIAGQRVFARNNIEVVMTVKKELSLDSPDTVVKCYFEPTDTVVDVYKKFNKVIEENTNLESNSDFDKTAKVLTYLPRFLLRFAVRVLEFLDYYFALPKFLLKVSPFHGSFIITSMGSLGIPPIYHHLYNFGTLPIFLSYGAKRKVTHVNDDGTVEIRPVMDITVVTDERICDGFYYAGAFKMMRRLIKNPYVLLDPPEKVIEDID